MCNLEALFITESHTHTHTHTVSLSLYQANPSSLIHEREKDQNLHESIIDADDKHLTSILDAGVVDVAGDMLLGARTGEGGGYTDDDAVVDAGAVLLGQIHLVAGRVLLQLDARDLVAYFDEGARRHVELTGCDEGTDGSCGPGKTTDYAESHGWN